MGFLNFFSKPQSSGVRELPTGSFTVDRTGQVVASTLPATVPTEISLRIAQVVLASFQGAREAGLHLSEVTLEYPALKITARELRGGAMVFLAPRGPQQK